ncbi:MAG: hypothetical protein K5765_03170 [Clostridia bacterium]|nr:hypothetical protein [Clostridia bacterium]
MADNKNIQWWSESALKSPEEKKAAPVEEQAPVSNPTPTRTSNMLEPLIQPIVVVPYTQDYDEFDEDEELARQQEEYDVKYQNDVNQYMSIDHDKIYSAKPVLTKAQARQTSANVVPAGPVHGYVKKRIVFIILAALLSLVFLAMVVIPFIKSIDAINPYISIFKLTEGETTTYMFGAEPAVGAIGELTKMDLSKFAGGFLNMIPVAEARTTADLIFIYLLGAFALLYIAFDLIAFLSMFIAIFLPKKGNVYKKVKLGYCAIIMFISALGVLATGLMLNGGFADFQAFLLGSGAVHYCCSIGAYIMVGLPIILFILSCLNYKKVK